MNIVNTFTGARMNKDIDARLIPSTEYIDALNVDVINSTDGNKNGVLRNSKGNRRLETPTGVTIDVRTASGMPLTNPVVIGVCKYEPNNAIYWLIASDTEDIVVEYIDRPDTVSSVTAGLYGVVGDMTVILRSVKTTPTTPSLLGFNKSYLISGINYFNGFLLWTDNLSAPKMVNIADAKNWTSANPPIYVWNIDDIIVIVKPPVSAPSLFLKNDTNIKTNTKNKFLYFSYRYKYANSRWSSMAPFSKVGFFPSAFAYDQNAEANVGMQNIYNSVDITVNTGSRQVTDIQILFRDTSSNNVYIIETINKAHPILQTSAILDDSTFTYKSFDNNKIYTALPSRQLTRLFDNVPIKALAQDIIGGRLIYGNYTQFYDLKTDFNSLVLPNYTVSITSTPITTAAPPQPSLKTGRDYEIGLMYLDDYGRMSTVLTSPKNTIHLPYSKSGNKNSLVLDIAHFPPKWATKYRVAIKQSKDSYYNIYPRVAYLDGTGTWFKISNSDVNKIAAGDYVIIKTLYTGVSGDSKEYKVLEIAAKNFGEIVANTSLAGTYLKLSYTQAITSVAAYSFQSNILNSIFQGSAAQLGNAWLVGASKPNIHSSPCVLYRANGTSFKGASSGAVYSKINSPSKDIRYIIEYVGIVGAYHCLNYREFPSQTNINSTPIQFRHVSTGMPVAVSLLSSFMSVTIGKLDILPTHQLQVGDSWRVNVYSLFRGNTVSGGKINDLCGIVDSDSTKQEITGGTLIEFKIEDRTGSVATTTVTPPQSFIATKTYVDIQEWFWEDGAYLTFNYLSANNVSLGYKNVFFRNALPPLTVYGAPYNMNHITAALPTTSNSIVYMLLSSGTSGVFGSNSSLSGYVYIQAKLTYQKNVLCLETTPKDTDSKIFHECSEDFQIYQTGNNRCHTGDIQNQTTMQHARLNLPLTFNCFAFDNGVESNRIRDDFNAPTMEWSPRVNGVSEDYGQQVQSESLTYSGVYRADSNVNNLNEFNLSIGNFKNLEKSFGSIQKIKSRDNDLIVIHEDKITKVLYGKNLLSDSTGGGTVSSVPEVLGTQISYEGNYGISRDPMTFTEYAGDMWFSDVQRGVLLRLNNQGLFPISKNGMQSFFNTRFAADFSTKKIGAFDPVNKRYMYTDTSVKITKQPNTIIINSPVVDAMGSSLPNFLNNPVLSSSNNNPIP